MAEKALVDAGIWIEISRNSETGKKARDALAGMESTCTIVTVTEVLKYFEREKLPSQKQKMIDLFGKLQLTPIILEDAALASNLAISHKLYLADALALAVSINHKFALFATDSDFKKLKGLKGAEIRYFAVKE